MSDPRPDLASVRTQYQVPDDVMLPYRPRVLGQMDIPFTEAMAKTMTKTEGELLDRLTLDKGLLGLNKAHDIYVDAFKQGNARYADQPLPNGIPPERAREWQGNDGHRDAFRHAYWNARLTQEFGADWTRAYTTAHEGIPGNPANREAMDLYNNSIGIQIGAANPKATPDELAKLIQEAVTDGKMVVMNSRGEMAWSDRVPLGKHGLSPDDVIAPHMGKPGVVPTQSAAADVRSDGAAYAALSPQAQTLLRDSEHQVRQLAERHGLPWDQGMENTVAAVAQQARADGLTGINHFAVRDGQIRYGQQDGYILRDGQIDARVAANTPLARSHEALAQTDQILSRQPENRAHELEVPQRVMHA